MWKTPQKSVENPFLSVENSVKSIWTTFPDRLFHILAMGKPVEKRVAPAGVEFICEKFKLKHKTVVVREVLLQ